MHERSVYCNHFPAISFKNDFTSFQETITWAFQRYGDITMIRIQRNIQGEETKSAMICFKREEDAASGGVRVGSGVGVG